jgi:hypothetical protein
MAVDRQVIKWRSAFDWAQTLTTTAGYKGWTLFDTSAAGAPTALTVSGGGLALTIAADSEAEVLNAYQGDILPFALNKIKRMSFNAKVAGIDSVTTLVMGLASARNSTADSVALNAWFRMQGSASTTLVVTETDDGTTDNDDKATAVALSSTYKRFEIDFQNGLSDVHFLIDGARVSAATTFSMGAIVGTDYVQPYFQVQKASGTGVPAVTIRDVEIEYVTAVGA